MSLEKSHRITLKKFEKLQYERSMGTEPIEEAVDPHNFPPGHNLIVSEMASC